MKILKELMIDDIKGFHTWAKHTGVKKRRNDLCIIYSDFPCVSAGVFTKNKIKAHPISISMEKIKNPITRAIVVNSGNANACNGPTGLENGNLMIEKTSLVTAIPEKEILIASTGIIGLPLDMDKISAGLFSFKAHKSLPSDAAEAICTTDTFSKHLGVQFNIDGKKINMSCIAKGSGMVHPNMGTMLSFITTDISISKEMLNEALQESIIDSYNMISVDGDTSTNDCVFILANAQADNTLISSKDENYYLFLKALDLLNTKISKMIAQDGEGATKLIETNVVNAPTKEDARILAKSVISSSLVKSAFFGCDANWGRILCALGYSEGSFNPDSIDISFESSKGRVQIMENGKPSLYSPILAKSVMDDTKVDILIDLNSGNEKATSWGCDLTYDYVKINGSYTN